MLTVFTLSMDFFLSSSAFLSRNANALCAVVAPAVVVLGGAAVYSSRIFANHHVEVAPQEIVNFVFHNGVIQPHNEYLFGYSEGGQHFVVGSKAPGHDYSKWEARYESFGRSESVAVESSGFRATWTWFVEGLRASANLYLTQMFLGIIIMTLCAFLFHQMKKKSRAKSALCKAQTEHANEVELQCIEIARLKQLVESQTSYTQSLESELEEVSEENLTHINTIVDLQEQIKTLGMGPKTMITVSKISKGVDLSKKESEDNNSHNDADTEHDVVKPEKVKDPIEAADTGDEITESAAGQDVVTPVLDDRHVGLKEPDTEDGVAPDTKPPQPQLGISGKDADTDLNVVKPDSVQELIEAADTGDEVTESAAGQDVVTPALDDPHAGLKEADIKDGVVPDTQPGQPQLEICGKPLRAADTGDEITENAAGQDVITPAPDAGLKEANTEDGAAPDTQPAQSQLGISGKPLQRRRNRRSDGTVRSKAHPQYVPSVQEATPPTAALPTVEEATMAPPVAAPRVATPSIAPAAVAAPPTPAPAPAPAPPAPAPPAPPRLGDRPEPRRNNGPGRGFDDGNRGRGGRGGRRGGRGFGGRRGVEFRGRVLGWQAFGRGTGW